MAAAAVPEPDGGSNVTGRVVAHCGQRTAHSWHAQVVLQEASRLWSGGGPRRPGKKEKEKKKRQSPPSPASACWQCVGALHPAPALLRCGSSATFKGGGQHLGEEEVAVNEGEHNAEVGHRQCGRRSCEAQRVGHADLAAVARQPCAQAVLLGTWAPAAARAAAYLPQRTGLEGALPAGVPCASWHAQKGGAGGQPPTHPEGIMTHHRQMGRQQASNKTAIRARGGWVWGQRMASLPARRPGRPGLQTDTRTHMQGDEQQDR